MSVRKCTPGKAKSFLKNGISINRHKMISDLLAECERLRGVEDQAHGEGIIAGERIAALERENAELKSDLSGRFFVMQIRQGTARECVEIAENWCGGHRSCECGRGIATTIKSKFGLGE